MRTVHIVVSLLALIAMPADGAMREQSATLRGRWRVGPVVDPSHQPLPPDLAAQLAQARLPLPGETVRAVSGKLCVGSVPCDEVSWTMTTFGDSEYGEGLMRTFGLTARTRVYQGATGNRTISYTVFERSDRTLIALVSLCQDSIHARGCRAASEAWLPASPDAKIELGPARR